MRGRMETESFILVFGNNVVLKASGITTDIDIDSENSVSGDYSEHKNSKGRVRRIMQVFINWIKYLFRPTVKFDVETIKIKPLQRTFKCTFEEPEVFVFQTCSDEDTEQMFIKEVEKTRVN